jgi:hypothetical protein
MRTVPSSVVLKRLALLLACLCCGMAGQAAPPAATPAPSTTTAADAPPPAVPKSVFENPLNESGFSKECFHDPFFPKSPRYQPKPVVVQPTIPGPTTQQVVDSYAGVIVKGISFSPTRRFATVNNQTFAPGDKWPIKTPTGTIVLKVLEIKERSVVVEVEGAEPKELPLKF